MINTRSRLLFLTFLVISLFISACSNNSQVNNQNSTENNNDKTESANKEQIITINALSEPPSLEPALIDNQIAGDISNQLFEGLVRLDKEGNIAPGVAEKWDVSEDGTVYTFHLNKNAKWSNGDQVQAEDFVYSWEKVLRPEVAAPLGSNLFFIKNGAAYNEGTIKDPAELGVKAVDEYTLEVTLEKPTSFFLGLTAFFTLLPINKEVDQANTKWASEAESFVSNGPFKIESWKHGQELIMVPNENYWGKDVVKLDKLKWVMVNEQNTEYAMYQSNELDFSANLPNSIRNKLISSGEAKTAPSASLAYLRFNHNDKIFANEKIRQALSLALDRNLLVEKVTQGGEIPALGLIPIGLSSGAGEFRELAGDTLFQDNDVETAKTLLQEGLDELELSAFPKMNLLFYTDDTYNKLSQAMQEMWKKNLGIEVELQTMERKVFVQNVQAGDYQFAIYSTGADYDDASNLMGQFMTGDVYNYSNISIPEYDLLMKKAEAELNLENRAKYLVEAEKVLIDQMAISPLYYRTKVYLQKDHINGIYQYTIQAIDFREAYVK
ncbi:peptide ABC transporter substrate-binding protein [Cytobacillus sp. FSL W8-0315]|uniref:peptide ABC transporter substrate-binding protein n=1 Tax=Cytobacillus TaxID=2675230 RepID=UPI0002D9A21D|nr:peptide ABC transporter substrate-binding protein [Cytobacillus pseudoceanisediminis]UQX57177.1 peptide ABC transporter substrate-binding protein [Cytobacillus pseudoceanisediminis]